MATVNSFGENNLIMKLISLFIAWIKRLFSQAKKVTNPFTPKVEFGEPKTTLTNKEKRDLWLAKCGYVVRELPSKLLKKEYKQPPSNYMAQVFKFIELKRKGSIDIKPYRNRHGIPFYSMKKQRIVPIT